jgi:hypothetical protein
VNEDLTRSDGAIQCTQLTEARAIALGWRMLRALRILLDFLG